MADAVGKTTAYSLGEKVSARVIAALIGIGSVQLTFYCVVGALYWHGVIGQ